MYSAYVLPIIDYGCVIYHPHSLRNIKLIESIQKYFVKRIPQFYHSRLSYSERLAALHLDTLELRMIKIALCYVYKIIYGHVDLPFTDFFRFTYTLHGTRGNGLKLAIENVKSNKRKFFFSVRLAKIWNSLPCHAVTCSSIKQFKSYLNESGIMQIIEKYTILRY